MNTYDRYDMLLITNTNTNTNTIIIWQSNNVDYNVNNSASNTYY